MKRGTEVMPLLWVCCSTKKTPFSPQSFHDPAEKKRRRKNSFQRGKKFRLHSIGDHGGHGDSQRNYCSFSMYSVSMWWRKAGSVPPGLRSL